MRNAKQSNKRGQVTFMIVFFIAGTLMLIIAAFAVPTGIRLTSELYAAGDDLIQQSNVTIANISDTSVRDSIQGAFGEATSATTSNIEVYTAIYKYGWILAIIAVCLIIFMSVRRLVEFGGGGFV